MKVFCVFILIIAMTMASCPGWCPDGDDEIHVCGVNKYGRHKTFASRCHFDVERCGRKLDAWTFVKNGYCDPNSK